MLLLSQWMIVYSNLILSFPQILYVKSIFYHSIILNHREFLLAAILFPSLIDKVQIEFLEKN